MEYYSAMNKNEILPFATTWMGLDDNMLSEISEGRMVVTRGWEGSEKWGDVGQRCTLRYKMNNFRRPNIQHGDCS